jgi:hypothetical protein
VSKGDALAPSCCLPEAEANEGHADGHGSHSLQVTVKRARLWSGQNPSKEQRMNGQLPIEGQKVQVKLKEGDWQEAVYRGENFVDVYGLPLGFDKIAEWRAIAVKPVVNGASRLQRSSLKTAATSIN